MTPPGLYQVHLPTAALRRIFQGTEWYSRWDGHTWYGAYRGDPAGTVAQACAAACRVPSTEPREIVRLVMPMEGC